MSKAKRIWLKRGIPVTSTCCPNYLSRQFLTTASTFPCSYKNSSAEHIHAFLCMSPCAWVCVCVSVCEWVSVCVCVCVFVSVRECVCDGVSTGLLNFPMRDTISGVQNLTLYWKIYTVSILFVWVYKRSLAQGLSKTLDPCFYIQ